MYSDLLCFYRPLHAAIIASGSLCVYLKSTLTEKKKKRDLKATHSKNVNLEIAKTVSKYVTKMYSSLSPISFTRKLEN